MMLDIKSDKRGKPDLLSIEVAIDKESKGISYFSFAVPNQVDRSKGLTIEFTGLDTKPGGANAPRFEKGIARTLTLEECKDGLCSVKINHGVITAPNPSDKLDLLAHFLKHQSVQFTYWVRGHKVTAEASLLGFQIDFPSVLKELNANYH